MASKETTLPGQVDCLISENISGELCNGTIYCTAWLYIYQELIRGKLH